MWNPWKTQFLALLWKGKIKILENADVIAANFAGPGFVQTHQTGTREIKNSKDSLGLEQKFITRYTFLMARLMDA